MVAFMLDDPCMKPIGIATDFIAELVETLIMDFGPAWHYPAHSGNGEATFPTRIDLIGDGTDNRD